MNNLEITYFQRLVDLKNADFHQSLVDIDLSNELENWMKLNMIWSAMIIKACSCVSRLD